MQVYFLRHGLADRGAWDGDDFHRPLTPEGRNRIKRTAKTIDRLGLRVDRIVSSPLTRALQTAEIVAKHLDTGVDQDERLAGGFGPRELQEILDPMPTDARVMLVGPSSAVPTWCARRDRSPGSISSRSVRRAVSSCG